jgi:hypothetical protein
MAGTATNDHMAHVLRILDNKDYKHTLRICNTYSFFTAEIVKLKRFLLLYITIEVYLEIISKLSVNHIFPLSTPPPCF